MKEAQVDPSLLNHFSLKALSIMFVITSLPKHTHHTYIDSVSRVTNRDLTICMFGKTPPYNPSQGEHTFHFKGHIVSSNEISVYSTFAAASVGICLISSPVKRSPSGTRIRLRFIFTFLSRDLSLVATRYLLPR